MRLDTRAAKADLRDLHRAQEHAYRSARNASDRGLGGALWRRAQRHLPTIAGGIAGYSAIHRLTGARSTGTVDPWAEALVKVKAAAQQFTDETVGYSARAKKLARQEIARDYALQAGATGKYGPIPPFIFRVHQQVLERREIEERGLNILRQDPRFTGPSIGELVVQVGIGYVNLIQKSFGYIWEGLTR